MQKLLKRKLHEVKSAVGVGNSSYIVNIVLRFQMKGDGAGHVACMHFCKQTT